MDHPYKIELEEVLLRPLQQGDIEQLRVWRNDASNSAYIRKIPAITPAAQQEWFEACLNDESTLTFAIENEGNLIGSVALYDLEKDQAEFGRLMIGTAKGQGIGRKATMAVLKIAFEVLGLELVHATASVDNTAALVIYSRVGFCIVGREHNKAARMDEFLLVLDRERFGALKQIPNDGFRGDPHRPIGAGRF